MAIQQHGETDYFRLSLESREGVAQSHSSLFPTEIVEGIAGYLDHVDLACFRAVNRRLRGIIQFDGQPYSHYETIFSHNTRQETIRKLAGPEFRKDKRDNLAGVHIQQDQYTECIGWAIMCRFEKDADLTKAKMLTCCGCKTKHLRDHFPDWMAEFGMHPVLCEPGKRMCVRSLESLFGMRGIIPPYDSAVSDTEPLRYWKEHFRKLEITQERGFYCYHCRRVVFTEACRGMHRKYGGGPTGPPNCSDPEDICNICTTQAASVFLFDPSLHIHFQAVCQFRSRQIRKSADGTLYLRYCKELKLAPTERYSGISWFDSKAYKESLFEYARGRLRGLWSPWIPIKRLEAIEGGARSRETATIKDVTESDEQPGRVYEEKMEEYAKREEGG